MKNLKYYSTIFIFAVFCVGLGAFSYSQRSKAMKTIEQTDDGVATTTEILSYESDNFKYLQIGTGETPPANSEGNANDIVSNNNGELENGTAFAPGKVAQAFSFDSVDDFVSINDFPALTRWE